MIDSVDCFCWLFDTKALLPCPWDFEMPLLSGLPSNVFLLLLCDTRKVSGSQHCWDILDRPSWFNFFIILIHFTIFLLSFSFFFNLGGFFFYVLNSGGAVFVRSHNESEKGNTSYLIVSWYLISTFIYFNLYNQLQKEAIVSGVHCFHMCSDS